MTDQAKATAPTPPKELIHRGSPNGFMGRLRKALSDNAMVGQDSMVMSAIKSFTDKRGGYSGIADFWDHTHKKVEASPSAHVKLGWSRLLYEMCGKHDEENQKALESSVSEDELHYIMIGGMLEDISKNQSFARVIAIECIKSLANDLDQFARDALREIESLALRAQTEEDFTVPDETLLDPVET